MNMSVAIGNRMDRERQQRASLTGQLEWRMQRQRDDRRCGEQAAFDSALLNARQDRANPSHSGQSADADSLPLTEPAQGDRLLSGAESSTPVPTHCKEVTSSIAAPTNALADNTPPNGTNHAMPGLVAVHEAEPRQRGELPQESVMKQACLQGSVTDERAGGRWRFELTDQNLPIRALAVERAQKGGLCVTLHVPDQPDRNAMQAPLLRLQHRLAGYGASLAAEDETAGAD